MIRLLTALVLFLALPVQSLAATGGMVTFTQGSTKVNGYLAMPAGEGTHPGVIVVHEWWGLTDWVKQQSDSLAVHGYVALAVDLYGGRVARDEATAHQLANSLDDAQAVNALRAGADFLRSRSDVRAQAIGVIGWCMGGGLAIRLAADDPGIRAAVMYYGAPLTDPKAIQGLQAAVLGNFGADDKGITPDKVKAFDSALKKAGKTADIKIYTGAPHAFANVNNPWGGYREAAAKDAWRRTLAFYDRELKRASVPKGRK
jgi:carboxymethylenebutenolidase